MPSIKSGASVAWQRAKLPITPILLLVIAGCATRSLNDPTPSYQDAVFFINAGDITAIPSPLAWNLPTRYLRDSNVTGVALEAQAAPGWSATDVTISDDTLEVYLLDGDLQVGNVVIAKGDYLRFDVGTAIPALRSDAGARFLLFSDTKRPRVSVNADSAAQSAWTHVRADETPWMAGTAMLEAGRDDVPLRIKHFRNDPRTGARTYLVSVRPGLSIPWEVHDVAEEAYILEGDFTLPECLADGIEVGRYDEGGYFYRPPEIAHNGPQSGTEGGVTMLIRTSGALTVELVEGC